MGALGAVGQQDGVGVVDVDEDAPAHGHGRGRPRACRPGPVMRHVAHARAGLGAGAGAIISSSRNSVPSKNTLSAPAMRAAQRRRHRGAAGDEEQRGPAAGATAQSPIVSPSSARPGSPPRLGEQRHLARHGEGFGRRGRAARPRHPSARRARRAASRGAARQPGSARGRSGWRRARRALCGAGIEREGLAFAQVQQAGDGVDLRPGQHHGGDRRMADAAPGRGCRAGVAAICARRSGEAFSSTQRSPSALTASDAWVRGGAAGSPARARRQPGRRNSTAETRRRRPRRARSPGA